METANVADTYVADTFNRNCFNVIDNDRIKVRVNRVVTQLNQDGYLYVYGNCRFKGLSHSSKYILDKRKTGRESYSGVGNENIIRNRSLCLSDQN